MLIDYWWMLVGALLLAVAGGRWWLQTPGGTETMDRLKLSIFLVRDIFVQLYLVQSMRLMAMSMANGVSVMDTLDACREVVRNNVFNRFIAQLQVSCRRGRRFLCWFCGSRLYTGDRQTDDKNRR